MPGGAAHHSARRPSSWWLSRYITNVFLPRMNHAGEPWLSRSVTSGRDRHTSRTRSSVSTAVSLGEPVDGRAVRVGPGHRLAVAGEQEPATRPGLVPAVGEHVRRLVGHPDRADPGHRV